MRRTVVALLLIAFKLGLGAAAQEPFITVAVYNRAAMKTETLLSGEREASRILGTAGVPMHWQNCRTAPGGVGDNCLAAMNDNTLVLTIVSRSPQQALKAEEMGQALQNVDGNGSHCYIFRSRVDEIAAFAHISSERLLDAAIAHELGHLLKGLNSHSPQGVMSGHWGEREIRAVGRGGLGFTKQDIEQIRKKLHQASSAGLQMDRITVQ